MSGVTSGLLASLQSKLYWVSDLYSFDNAPGSITSDSSENSYITGYFVNTGSGYDPYIVKYDKNGTLQWQKTLVGPGAPVNRNTYFTDIKIDSSSNLYTCGSFINASAVQNGIIAKYNSSGTLQWQRSVASPTSSDTAQLLAVAVDSSANAYTTGVVSATLGSVIKLNTSGTVQWQRLLTNPGSSYTGVQPQGADVDSSSNLYICGVYQNTSGGLVGFIAKYDTSGTLQWQRQITDANAAASTFTVPTKIAVDSSGNSYVSGYFKNTSGGYNAFVLKYDTSGTLQWQRQIQDNQVVASQSDQGLNISIDSSGNNYIVGYFKNANNGYSAFVLKYNSSGTLQWQRQIYNNLITISQEELTGVKIDSTGNLYLAGFAYRSPSFQLNSFIAKVTNDGLHTGDWVFDSTLSLNYSASSVQDSAGILTDTAGTITSGTGTATVATSTTTSSTSSLNNIKISV